MGSEPMHDKTKGYSGSLYPLYQPNCLTKPGQEVG